jgi:hypothetical protein
MWILNMATRDVGGVQKRSMSHMGWGFRRISRGAEGSFLLILDLRSMIAPKLDFDIMCGVGSMPSRQIFRICSVWPVVRMLLRYRSFRIF